MSLEIATSFERLDEGMPEERAAFGMFTVQFGESFLTEGFDSYVPTARHGPLVSGYHAAEWFAWNWWRLCNEPRSKSPDAWHAHMMASIGEGYVWPNLSIFSDGVRTTILSDRSIRPDAKPFRFFGAPPCVMPTGQFQEAAEKFIAQIQQRLRESNIPETNLDRICTDLRCERTTPEIALTRKFEALLGYDPDEGNSEIVRRLMADTRSMGEKAMQEVAADHSQGGLVMTADDLRDTAGRAGFPGSQRDTVRLGPGRIPPEDPNRAAWQLGTLLAQALREQEKFEDRALPDDRLSALTGVTKDCLSDKDRRADIAYMLDGKDDGTRIVFRSKWPTGRRFELARLLGDRLMNAREMGLFPATRAYTFRQKAQRSFAAELLAPYQAVEAMLGENYSDEEAQKEVATHFQVSELTIRTLLVNHHLLDRGEVDDPDTCGYAA